MIFLPVRWIVETSRHPPPSVFVFTSGCCGGPEWAERIAFNSKPIRMHFCCTPPPPISSLGRLSRTDDVTDCCEQFPWKRLPPLWPTFQGALPPFSNTPPPPSPPHLPHSASPPCHPSLLTPHLMRTEERWVEGVGRGLTAVDRKNVTVRKTKTTLGKKKIPALDWSGEEGGVL